MQENKLEYRRELKHIQYEKYFGAYDANIESLDKIIENVKEQEKSNQINHDVILVLSRKNRKVEYLTKNVLDLIGYSVQEIEKLGSAVFFKIAKWGHIDCLRNSRRWTNAFKEEKFENLDDSTKNTKILCGLKVKTKNNGIVTLLVKSFNPGANDENSDTIIYYFTDISHLFKGDSYWINYVSGNKSTRQFRHSSENVKTTKHIISGREKEVLLATMEGRNKSEVGILLNISPETVSKHKKNMLARTGAKDTTPLVHILKICGVI